MTWSTLAQADTTLPYHGDHPGQLNDVADRVSDARRDIAHALDGLGDAQAGITDNWVGVAADVGDHQVSLLRLALTGAADRLDQARSALLWCADAVRDTRDSIDGLRAQWALYQDAIDDLNLLIAASTDPVLREERCQQRDRSRSLQASVVDYWSAAAASADAATVVCRRRLDAASHGDWSYTPGTGLGRPTLAAALGVTLLTADDQHRATAGADEAAWGELSPDAQAFALTVGLHVLPVQAAGTPVEVAAAWGSLTPMQQQALIHARPGELGALDGVPVAARDQANRRYLVSVQDVWSAELARLPSSLDTVVGTPVGDPVGFSVVDWRRALLEHQLDLAATVAAQVGAVASGRYLIGLSLTGRGQAIIAVGNPDTATAVATYVPGTGADVQDLDVQVGRAVATQAAAVGAGASSVAVVAWIGYETPPTLSEAGFDVYADNGAAGLAEFLDGQRATHLGTPSLNTLIVHSYGGLLTSAAAAVAPLPVDQVVMVASAGTELDSVQQLALEGVPPDQLGSRVFSVVHTYDLIRLTGPVHSGLPSEPEFGATVVPADPPTSPTPGAWYRVGPPNLADRPDPVTAHGSYWDSQSLALRDLGQLVAGICPR